MEDSDTDLYYNEDELSDDGFYASLDDMGIYDNAFGHFITSYICYFCVECMHLFFLFVIYKLSWLFHAVLIDFIGVINSLMHLYICCMICCCGLNCIGLFT